jgi:hypothetical protein
MAYPASALLGLVATAAVAAGCGSVAAHAGARSPAVPWVGRRAPAYQVPPDRVVPYPTSAPRCRTSQLRASRLRSGAAMGQVTDRFSFTNTGAGACLATGFPAVLARTATGSHVLRARRSPDGGFQRLVAADIEPGQAAELDLTTEDVTCTPAHAPYRDLAFRMPDGGTLRTGMRLAPECGRWMISRLGLPQRRMSDMSPAPGSLGTLRVTWSLRGRPAVSAGSALRYVVTLSNPTHVTVPLSPCPTYTEGIYPASSPTWTVAYYLDCTAVRVIAPGQRIRFRMVQRIPRTARGIAKLGWHLDTPDEPAAVTVVTVGG